MKAYIAVIVLLISQVTSFGLPFGNGDFEEPALPAFSGFDITGGELPKWTKTGSGRVALGNGPAASVPPASGSQHVSFNSGDQAVGGVLSQTFDTFVGTTYEVTFYIGRVGPGSGDVGMTVSVRDSTSALLFSNRFAAPGVPGYGSASRFTFTAATTSTTLAFEDTSSSTVSVDLHLDAVSVHAPGSLDASFSSGGKLVAGIGNDNDNGNAVAIQADGKIVVVGSSGNGTNSDFAILRLNTDGTLDTSFNGTGKITTAIGGADEIATAVAIQSDGRIVVAGYTGSAPNYSFAIVRYTGDGSLDTSFNGTGKLIPVMGGYDDRATGVAVQADDKIVVAGFSYNGVDNADFALARFNANGSLDTTFNTTGKVVTSIDSSYDLANAVTIDGSAKIVVAGSSANPATSEGHFAIVRYNANGTLDTSFNLTGKVVTQFGGAGSQANGIALQDNGKIVAAGSFASSVAVARYNDNGSLDTSFNGTGKLTTKHPSSNSEQAKGVAVQRDGTIVVAGYSLVSYDPPGAYDIVVTRFNSNGTLDATFDSDGYVFTGLSPYQDIANGVALQADGRIVVAGWTFNGSNSDFAIARYYAATGLKLEAYYPFNGNASDESGKAHHGTVTGAALTTDRFGAAGKAYQFDGVDDFIDCGNAAALNIGTGNLTLSAWVKFSGSQVGKYIVGKYSAPQPNAYGLGTGSTSAGYGFLLGSSQPSAEVRGSKDIGDSVWHQMVLVIDRTLGLFLYVDGVLDVSNSSVGAQVGNLTNNDPLTIGKIFSGQHINAAIDDIRLYKSALGETEVLALYASEAPLPEITIEHPLGTELVDGTASAGYGVVTTGTSPTKTFTVRNIGGSTLTISSVNVNGGNAGDFLVNTDATMLSLAPSQSTTLSLTFTPSAAGNRSTTLQIFSNDSNEAVFDIGLTGVALAPEIEVRQPSVASIPDGGVKNFGTVGVNGNASLVFTVKNTGEGDLTGLGITIDGTDSEMFSVTSPPVAPVSAPTGSTTFTVQFAPTSAGPKTAALHIANNDLDENPFDITLLGNVSAQESWRQTQFGSIENSGDGADLNDYDRDGLVNLVEFAFGLNPKQNSAGQLPQGQIIGPNYVLFFNQPSGMSGITYGAAWSPTLLPLSWTPITDTGLLPQHTFSVPIGSNTRMFMRLTVFAQSAGTTLDFESPLPGGLIAATHSHLAAAPSAAVVSTQYANFGVIFGGAVLLNLGSGQATSGTNSLGGLDAQGRFNSGAPISLTFVSPADGQTSATIDFFSVHADLGGNSSNGALISAYDITGALLGTATYQEPGQNGLAPIVVSGIGRIHTIIMDATLNNMTTGVGGIQFDQVSFSAPVVP